MYDVVLKDYKWWITYNGNIVKELGSFDEPVSPKIIIKEIEDEV